MDRRRLIGGLSGLALAAPLGVAARAKAPATRLAMTVGLNTYQSLDPLKRAEADALAVDARLKAIGYQTKPSLSPTQAELNVALEDFVSQISPETSALFFYAGHGFEAGGANYVTVRDTSPQRERLFESSVSLNGILDRIAQRRPRQAIIVLDACRQPSWLRGAERDRQGFTSVVAPNGFYIVYSAGSGEFALDDLGAGDHDPNSVFTRAFLRQLDPDLSVDAVIKAARVEVTRTAARVGHPQHPAIYDQTTQIRSLRGDVVSAGAEPTAGELPRTLALVVGVENAYGLRITAPSYDMRMVAYAFGAMGAEVRTLLNPDVAAVRALLRNAAASDAEHIVVYWTGIGGYLGGPGREDAVFLTRFQCVESRVLVDQAINLSEILGTLRAEGRRTTVLADMCLDRMEHLKPPVSTGEAMVARAPPVNSFAALMRATLQDSERDGGPGEAAALFGTGLDGIALDTLEGQPHGAFALALVNALARPGVSLRDAARVVRREVEGMTKGEQSPLVVGTRGALAAPLVQLSVSDRAKGRPAEIEQLRPGAGLQTCGGSHGLR